MAERIRKPPTRMPLHAQDQEQSPSGEWQARGLRLAEPAFPGARQVESAPESAMMNATSSSASGDAVAAGTIPRMGAWGGDCVMLASNLLLLVILGQTPGEQTDPAALVAQLGSGRYAERKKRPPSHCSVSDAPPSRSSARPGARDMEIRNRAFNLIQKIEGAS